MSNLGTRAEIQANPGSSNQIAVFRSAFRGVGDAGFLARGESSIDESRVIQGNPGKSNQIKAVMAGSCAGHRVLASLLTAISRFDALRLRFDKPFDGLRVVSVVEPLNALSVEGHPAVAGLDGWGRRRVGVPRRGRRARYPVSLRFFRRCRAMMNAGIYVLILHGRAHAVNRRESEQKNSERAAEFSDRLGICGELNAEEPLFRPLCLNLPVR